MTAVGYEWIIKAYTVKIRLPIVFITLSLKMEDIKKETSTRADPM